ncbi:hypothetical protein FM106_07960 [Brachybacterium faecium]|nr:hypothetical protein FM106_07960 [Brachybacterium faecium]
MFLTFITITKICKDEIKVMYRFCKGCVKLIIFSMLNWKSLKYCYL